MVSVNNSILYDCFNLYGDQSLYNKYSEIANKYYELLIATGELMEGEFPPKAKALVKEFVMKYQKELNHMWETEQYVKLPPLD